ncbi:2',3'-cyclic-nucleotide 3'-phosphodiesterase [Lactifluus volemus]|nr:2',3'-cyclic-nucleotide 3'-phosphodiesterase [Lactifluus volemus]
MGSITLWLVPSEPEAALLQQLMDRRPEQSAHHSFPHFHPHVTLATLKPASTTTSSESTSAATSETNDASNRERAATLLALREALPLGQPAVDIRFERVVTGDHYFRSVYIVLQRSRELVELREALGTTIRGPEPPAFPHLSLYYIADEDAHERARVLQELERDNVVGRSANPGRGGVMLKCASGEGDVVALDGFLGTQIWIMDCEGPVEGWKVIDKILLAKSDR